MTHSRVLQQMVGGVSLALKLATFPTLPHVRQTGNRKLNSGLFQLVAVTLRGTSSSSEKLTSVTEQSFEEPSTGRSFLRVCSYLIAIVPLLIFAASLLGRYSLLCELASNFRLYILGLLVVTAPVLLSLKSRSLAIAWIVAVAWGMVGTATVYLPSGQAVPSNAARR